MIFTKSAIQSNHGHLSNYRSLYQCFMRIHQFIFISIGFYVKKAFIKIGLISLNFRKNALFTLNHVFDSWFIHTPLHKFTFSKEKPEIFFSKQDFFKSSNENEIQIIQHVFFGYSSIFVDCVDKNYRKEQTLSYAKNAHSFFLTLNLIKIEINF